MEIHGMLSLFHQFVGIIHCYIFTVSSSILFPRFCLDPPCRSDKDRKKKIFQQYVCCFQKQKKKKIKVFCPATTSITQPLLHSAIKNSKVFSKSSLLSGIEPMLIRLLKTPLIEPDELVHPWLEINGPSLQLVLWGVKWTGTAALGPKEPDPNWVEERNRILGDPLSEEEVAELVERYRHSDCARQINLGKGGVTHNMLDDIHNHWKKAEAVRIKCLGVPTLDMDNVCFHLEDKSGGKIIYRHINIILLYRGRNYDPKNRTVIPLMLWKPYAPIYPKLVKNVADGLTFEETKEMRSRGLMSPPVMKLTRNGVYVNVVERVREAFKTEEVVRLDCSHVGTNDCKKIGVKLRDLVPCVPILFKDDQIILWRGKKEETLDSYTAVDLTSP
ncbi:hypothetical protein JRO89_XS15G0156600 [Xanthoceras sorbifolium]|uniref:CRM domain-containing protein n=1 Tax=Xanthoceras sorbifolium TaxID=99658 RepID=A0ABQ8H2D2_9ROSI|nr:hypothetical protein JRO89_XS15G0156600 [Xanthoceras sorbifolium]